MIADYYIAAVVKFWYLKSPRFRPVTNLQANDVKTKSLILDSTGIVEFPVKMAGKSLCNYTLVSNQITICFLFQWPYSITLLKCPSVEVEFLCRGPVSYICT